MYANNYWLVGEEWSESRWQKHVAHSRGACAGLTVAHIHVASCGVDISIELQLTLDLTSQYRLACSSQFRLDSAPA